MNTKPHPLFKAADIRASLQDGSHWLNTNARTQSACLSDRTGLGNEIGVHLVVLPPHAESSEIHHHINESEWAYVLKGSGTLRLAPVDLGDEGLAPKPFVGEIEKHSIGEGDFMGHPGGSGEGYFAHMLVAGPDGMEVLVGGNRVQKMDICVYPLAGKMLVGHFGANGMSRAIIETQNVIDHPGYGKTKKERETDAAAQK